MSVTTTTTVLRAENVRKDYTEGRETFTVLKGVSFSLERGEIVVLEGPSGSGKTTLLSILGCILTPTDGEVFVEGQRVDAKDTAGLAAIRKKSIGFVFQQYNLFGALTARENGESRFSRRAAGVGIVPATRQAGKSSAAHRHA